MCLQNDFLEWGSIGVPNSNALVALANEKMEEFETVIAVQEWHPADHVSFAANHPWRKPGQIIEVNGLKQKLWTMHGVQNTFGAELAMGLITEKITAVFQKGTNKEVDASSAFFDKKGEKASDLHDFLQKKGIETLFFMGMIAELDVQDTIADAQKLGLDCQKIEGGCLGF